MAEKRPQRKKKKSEDSRDLALLEEALGFLLPEEERSRAIRELENRLGGLGNILRTPETELAGIPGMDARTARYIRLTLELARACMRDAAGYMRDVMSFERFVELLRPEFFGRKTEAVAAVLLDGSARRLYSGLISEGSIASVPLNIRGLAGLCINYNASAVVLAHNHPTGSIMPSREDVITTEQIMMSLSGIDVELSDHIILTDDSEFSFRQSGMLRELTLLVRDARREQTSEARDMAARYMEEDRFQGGSHGF